jgi:hypothetical protein
MHCRTHRRDRRNDTRLRPATGWVVLGELDHLPQLQPPHLAVADEGAEARLGWLLLQIGQPQEALRSVDEALAINPDLDEARWFRANIQLYGLDDPAGAAVILQEMAGRDLDPELRQQVDRLLGTAQERIAGGAG